MTWRDQADLPRPDRAVLVSSTSGNWETYTVWETTVPGASFFTFLSHITPSLHKQRIPHQTSDRSRDTSAGDWWWRVYTNNVPPTTMKGDDRKINLGISWYGYFLEPQHKSWLNTLPQSGGHEEERTHNKQCTHKHWYKLDGADAQQEVWCVRCLLITESLKTPGHYRYLFWVLDNKQHVQWHKCEETSHSLRFHHLHLVSPTPPLVVHTTVCDVSSSHHLLTPLFILRMLFVQCPPLWFTPWLSNQLLLHHVLNWNHFAPCPC